eukprot:symbB.v1.2.015690.t1/scaffold1169.1/size134116/4
MDLADSGMVEYSQALNLQVLTEDDFSILTFEEVPELWLQAALKHGASLFRVAKGHHVTVAVPSAYLVKASPPSPASMEGGWVALRATDHEANGILIAFQAGLTRQILRRPARACKLNCALLAESLGQEIAYFLHHRLRNIGTLSEILDESSEDNLLQTLHSSPAKALKSLRTLLDSVLQ